MNLAGKVSLITGGAQGLGKKFGESLLQKGAKVCVADINQAKGETTVEDFKKRFGQGRALFVKCDVTSETDFENAFERTKSEYGRIDIVCNNAGIADEARWRQIIDINLLPTYGRAEDELKSQRHYPTRATVEDGKTSVIQGTILGVRYMRKDRGGEGGLIVNIASVAGLMSVDFLASYVASKTGVVAYTRSMAESPLNRETGIRFCALCPSFADTDILKMLPAQAADLARYEKILKVVGIMRPEVVADAFMELVEAENSNGLVLCVTKNDGKKYIPPPPKL